MKFLNTGLSTGGINQFIELAEFAISLLSLPHSNADIERVFSQMNLVKTKLRNGQYVPTRDIRTTLRTQTFHKSVNKSQFMGTPRKHDEHLKALPRLHKSPYMRTSET